MVTIEQIKQAVKNVEHVDISDDLGNSPVTGVRFRKDGYVVEILVDRIAVRGEEDDDLSWEFLRPVTLENVLKTVEDPTFAYYQG